MHATVVVEVKWSTNPETKSALIDQLGQRYLLRERLTHGVFLVGCDGLHSATRNVLFGEEPTTFLGLTQVRCAHFRICETGGFSVTPPQLVFLDRWH